MTKTFRETPMTMHRYKEAVKDAPSYEVHRINDQMVTISHYQLKREETPYNPVVSMRNYRVKV